MTLNRTRSDIIENALDLIGVKAAGEPVSAEDGASAATALDWLVKSWQNSGAHLWARDSAILFLQPAQIEYQIGGTNTDNATETFSETTLSATAAALATTITLTSTTGLAVGQFIGIKLDAGSVHWTTVKIVSPTTLNAALPSEAASGNRVFFYTTKIGKALRVPDARREQGSGVNAQEIEMIQMGRIDYLNLPNKNTSGTPVQFYYDPKIDFGTMFIWPAPTSTDNLLRFTYYRPLKVFTDSEDDPDFPNEWIEALAYNLAVRLAPRFGMPLAPEVGVLAVALHQNALDWDQDDAPVFFQYSRGRGQ